MLKMVKAKVKEKARRWDRFVGAGQVLMNKELDSI
jgi:hypothetical protein